MTTDTPREWRLTGDLAQNYERFGVPVIFRAWAEDLVQRAGLREGDRVLDVGCGTGIVSRLAVGKVGERGAVSAIDLLPAMLEVGKSADPASERIDWRQASANALPFDGGKFDVVLCQQAMQFFPDKPAAAREMHRVLKPGGRAVISVWQEIDQLPGYAALADCLAERLGPGAASFMGMLCALGDVNALQQLLEQAGFRDTALESVTMDYRVPSVEDFVWQMTQMTPLGSNPAVGDADASTRAKVIQDLESKLSSYISDEGLAFPLVAHVALARK